MKKFLFFLMAIVALTFAACEQPEGPVGPGTGGTDKPAVIDSNTVLTLSITDFALTPGETKRINVTLNPQPTGAYNLIWSSSNDAVATVKGGLVTGVANGNAVITVQIEGTEIKATANVKVGSAIDNVEFTNVEFLGYKADMLPLSVWVYDIDENGKPNLDENGDTVLIEVTDINGDSIDDYFIASIAYIMPKGMTIDGSKPAGTPNYLISVRTSIIFDGTYIYPFWTYVFSANEEEYWTEALNDNGKPCMKWRYATYTHFNPERYGNYYYRMYSAYANNSQWPSSQEEFDAWVADGGYFYDSNYDSYVGYLMVPDNDEAYVALSGLVKGGKGFAYDRVDTDGDGEIDAGALTYLDVELDFFANVENMGFAIEGEGDEAHYVVEGEGENAYFAMDEMISRSFHFDKRKSAPRRVMSKAPMMTMKRMEANILTNLPLVNILPR